VPDQVDIVVSVVVVVVTGVSVGSETDRLVRSDAVTLE
jgi:hypothetical protein